MAIGSKSPMDLIVQNGDFFKTYPLDYHGGERYPFLERVVSRPDLLGAILREDGQHE